MAMNVGTGGSSGEPEPMMDINTTPLIDVMLVLIIMLIITIPVQLHSVNLNMPAGNPPPPTQEPVVVTIEVDFDGTILWNGETIPNRQALQVKLRDAAAQAVQPEVHVRPNKLVEYKYVAEVLAESQRLGVTKLGMVGNEQFVK
jgi:biopolymer transport protein ExbD